MHYHSKLPKKFNAKKIKIKIYKYIKREEVFKNEVLSNNFFLPAFEMCEFLYFLCELSFNNFPIAITLKRSKQIFFIYNDIQMSHLENHSCHYVILYILTVECAFFISLESAF